MLIGRWDLNLSRNFGQKGAHVNRISGSQDICRRPASVAGCRPAPPPDLRAFSPYQRKQKGMERKQLLLSLFDLSGVGLEIGPGFDPLVPKSSGRRIETVDHASAAELREKYRNAASVDISRIE